MRASLSKAKHTALIVLFLLLVATATHVSAQLVEDCDPFALAELARSSIPGPDEPPPDGKPETLWAQLRTVAHVILHADARCAGLAWEDDTERVIGPVAIPEGTYRATVITEGFFVAEVTPLDGTCGHVRFSSFSPLLLNLSRGDAVSGAEALLGSEGCEALLQISNVSAPWSLLFERIR